MNRTEFQLDVLPRLADLAEVFDRKPLPDGALRVWADVLGAFPAKLVADVLRGWGRSKTKFPAPSEVHAAVTEIETNEREAKVGQEQTREYIDARQFKRSEEALRALAAIRQLVGATLQQPPDPKDWAIRIIERYLAGDTAITELQLRYACEATGRRVAEVKDLRRRA